MKEENGGFDSKEDYEKFLKLKMKELFDKIKNNPELIAVFKRLNYK